VVFPTPPFWLAVAMAITARMLSGVCQEAS
jgi:hypothetical protein